MAKEKYKYPPDRLSQDADDLSTGLSQWGEGFNLTKFKSLRESFDRFHDKMESSDNERRDAWEKIKKEIGDNARGYSFGFFGSANGEVDKIADRTQGLERQLEQMESAFARLHKGEDPSTDAYKKAWEKELETVKKSSPDNNAGQITRSIEFKTKQLNNQAALLEGLHKKFEETHKGEANIEEQWKTLVDTNKLRDSNNAGRIEQLLMRLDGRLPPETPMPPLPGTSTAPPAAGAAPAKKPDPVTPKAPAPGELFPVTEGTLKDRYAFEAVFTNADGTKRGVTLVGTLSDDKKTLIVNEISDGKGGLVPVTDTDGKPRTITLNIDEKDDGKGGKTFTVNSEDFKTKIQNDAGLKNQAAPSPAPAAKDAAKDKDKGQFDIGKFFGSMLESLGAVGALIAGFFAMAFGGGRGNGGGTSYPQQMPKIIQDQTKTLSEALGGGKGKEAADAILAFGSGNPTNKEAAAQLRGMSKKEVKALYAANPDLHSSNSVAQYKAAKRVVEGLAKQFRAANVGADLEHNQALSSGRTDPGVTISQHIHHDTMKIRTALGDAEVNKYREANIDGHQQNLDLAHKTQEFARLAQAFEQREKANGVDVKDKGPGSKYHDHWEEFKKQNHLDTKEGLASAKTEDLKQLADGLKKEVNDRMQQGDHSHSQPAKAGGVVLTEGHYEGKDGKDHAVVFQPGKEKGTLSVIDKETKEELKVGTKVVVDTIEIGGMARNPEQRLELEVRNVGVVSAPTIGGIKATAPSVQK